MKFARAVLLVAVALIGSALLVVPSGAAAPAKSPSAKSAPAKLPPIKHVFVINLENKNYDETFGPDSPAPYLSQDLVAKGGKYAELYGIQASAYR